METRVKNQKQSRGKNTMQTKVRIAVAPPTQAHSDKVDYNRTQAKQILKKLLISYSDEGGI